MASFALALRALVVAAAAAASLGRASGDSAYQWGKHACPEGFKPVQSRDVCIQAAYDLLGQDFCYGLPWEQTLQLEHDSNGLVGCYLSMAPPGGCAFMLNMKGNQTMSREAFAAKYPVEDLGGSFARMCESTRPEDLMV
mmetsp:Transcript_80945/g.182642  ORF Transcript_80945/g.182642 Transcript_80945/m.182642 type:complete len:139 (+) Transcript_80945:89-505(+)